MIFARFCGFETAFFLKFAWLPVDVRDARTLPSTRVTESELENMATTEELRPSNRPAPAGRFPVRAFIVAALAALLGAAFLAGSALRRETPQVEFLQQALGEPAAAAPLTRTPDAETVVRLHEGGYSLDRGAVSVGLRSAVSGAGACTGFFSVPWGWRARSTRSRIPWASSCSWP